MDVNAKTNNGSSTLHYLCSFPVITNLFGIVRLLLDSGIDVNAINSRGFTALHYLCDTYSGHDLLDIVRLLIDKGANVSVMDNNGKYARDYFRFYQGTNKNEIMNLLG